MARLADDNAEEISLFPMFNILACTLGVMVFILATVATVSLGADKAVEIVANVDPGEDDPRTPIWLEWDGLNLTLLPSGEQATFSRSLDEISPEEVARIDSFVKRFQIGQRLLGSGRDEKAEQVFRDLLEEEPEAAAAAR